MSADDNFKLLLTHYPEYFLGKLNDYDIDLAITGHAHGGQVRLPFIGGLYAADQGLFLSFVTDTTKTVTVSSSFHAVWVNRELFRELIINLKS